MFVERHLTRTAKVQNERFAASRFEGFLERPSVVSRTVGNKSATVSLRAVVLPKYPPKPCARTQAQLSFKQQRIGIDSSQPERNDFGTPAAKSGLGFGERALKGIPQLRQRTPQPIPCIAKIASSRI